MQKLPVDLKGSGYLIFLSMLLASNQIAIKVGNQGFDPVFMAAARSLIGLLALLVWMYFRNLLVFPLKTNFIPGFFLGFFFAMEFWCLFRSLDYTSVARASIIFYSMPVWLALLAHFLLPNERLNFNRILGLALAIAGVFITVSSPNSGFSEKYFLGDILALLAAILWALIALTVRISTLANERAETQLFFQLAISLPILLVLSNLSPTFLREPNLSHFISLSYQGICVAAFGFLLWFWLVRKYSASGVASFAFLTPVFSVLLANIILNEAIESSIFLALILVSIGLYLINKRNSKTS